MSLLFVIENKIVKPNEETLLISPFKEIWQRDKTKNKSEALEDFAYIEFTTSEKKSNPYKGYSDIVKERKVKEDIITRKNWKEDNLIIRAKERIIDFQTNASATYTYYMSAKKAADKMTTFFNSFDIEDKNEKTGNPIYKPRDITSALNDTNTVLQNLNTLKDKVEQELFESTRTKGQKTISPFAQDLGLTLK